MEGKVDEKASSLPGYDEHERIGSVAYGADDAGAIPKGTIDPVYEAKARVLNRAVSVGMSIVRVVDPNSELLQIQDIGMGWYQWQVR